MKYIFLFFFSLNLMAQTKVVFEEVTTDGSGCLPGTVSSVTSPDGTSLSILFDEFRVEIPNHETPGNQPLPPRHGPNYHPPVSNNSLTLAHKTCNISFTTTLPAGLMATSINISVQARGNTMMDAGLKAYFSTILASHSGLANSVGPQVRVVDNKLWMTNSNTIGEDWIEDITVSVPLRSACASAKQRSIKFELKNHLEVKNIGTDLTKSGIVSVDSNDTQGMLKFSLTTAPCR